MKSIYWLATKCIAITEILLGGITLFAVIASLILRESAKPVEVLIFVLTTSGLSLGLGIGILKKNLASYQLLLFFSSVIVLSKILIFAKIISLNGALETTIPAELKNMVSVTYHSLIIILLTRQPVKKVFKEGP